jgi:acetyltransferase-like isoleucine patch superfamily enzyme
VLRKLYLLIRAMPKTLYFNFKYLPFKKAIRLPFIVSHRVWIMDAKGVVKINKENLSPAMIKIGFGEVGIFDQMRERSVWKVLGEVNFQGAASLGHGTKISVEEKGKLTLGENVIITAESSIICRNEIVLEDDVMVSWETQIMDSDLHFIKDNENNIINCDEKIKIGRKTWIGSRCTILKGVNLAPESIVAAGTIVSKAINKSLEGKEKCLIGGNTPKIIKEEVTWEK